MFARRSQGYLADAVCSAAVALLFGLGGVQTAVSNY